MQKDAAAVTAVGLILASAVVGGSFGPLPNHRAPHFGTSSFANQLSHPGTADRGDVGLLDILLIVSGYRLLVAPPSNNRAAALAAWAVSIVGVAAHPFLFFGRRSKIGGLAAATIMIASSATAAIAAAKVDRLASLCAVPLVVWSLLAGLLSEEIVREN